MWLEFGQVKSQLLILLIYPVGIISARIIGIQHPSNPLYYLFLFFVSHFLSLIPLSIYKIKKHISKLKKKKKEQLSLLKNNSLSTIISEEDKPENQLVLLKQKLKKEKKRYKILIFFLIAFLYFFTYTFFYYINYITKTQFYGNISMVTEVVYLSLFNLMIFGNKIYAHHFFSMILITISILDIYILLIIKYINNNNYNSFNDFILPTLLNLFAYCPFCFYLVLSKYYIEKYFISAYELIFYLGLFCLSLLIVFEPITFYISCPVKDDSKNVICYEKHFAGIISGFKQSKSLKGILFSIGIGVSLFMTSLWLWLTIKFLSPLYFLTSESIITVELNILVDYYGYRILIKDPLFYILSSVTIFGCLVYNEILIISVCGINYNTRKEILKRQIADLKYINCELSDLIRSDTGGSSENEEKL